MGPYELSAEPAHGYPRYSKRAAGGETHWLYRTSGSGKWMVADDESHIAKYRIMHQGSESVGESAQEDHHYPFAGAANPVVRLGVVATATPNRKANSNRLPIQTFSTHSFIVRKMYGYLCGIIENILF